MTTAPLGPIVHRIILEIRSLVTQGGRGDRHFSTATTVTGCLSRLPPPLGQRLDRRSQSEGSRMPLSPIGL